LQLAAARKAAQDEATATKIEEASVTVRESLQQIRYAIAELGPLSVEDFGLSGAIAEWLEEQTGKQHGLTTEFIDDSGQMDLRDDTRVALFRNVRELLANVVKHAEATTVTVQMTTEHGHLRIVVKDDGVGFDPEAVLETPGSGTGYGLFSVRERMTDMGGYLEVESAPGKSCTAVLIMPLEGAKEL
jgi:signal transduction histidine kinase